MDEAFAARPDVLEKIRDRTELVLERLPCRRLSSGARGARRVSKPTAAKVYRYSYTARR